MFNIHDEINNVEDEIIFLQNTLYDYFKIQYGTVKKKDDPYLEYQEKYSNLSKRQLKKALATLKQQNECTTPEIRYISKLIRSKYAKKSLNITNCSDDDRITENFWGYCKDVFEKDDIVKPGFDKESCSSYFKKTLSRDKTKRKFDFPTWMKKLNEPSNVFDLEQPTYKEITGIINKLKSSGSPCPHDQMSIIILKRCPILRTVIHRIISHCWREQKFPSCWKNAFTILLYKKGSNMEPSNFRPITLQPVFAKIYSSLIRNRIYNFLIDNKFIESNIQKGFWRSISGTIEHTELLTHIIKHAKNKQRQIIITLLDLKNAFGEVDHKLLLKVLEYHHIPDEIKRLINDYYKNYTITVGTETFSTDPLVVGKGVLQGDCLSPLLFNMIINTLIKTIDDERIRCMGYNFCNSLSPRNWFQFADDSAPVTATEQDSQLLLNVFTKWCKWANLIVRVDKCKTFGIKKNGTLSTQFKPCLRVNNELIPPVKMGDCFIYLGKSFSFSMNNSDIKTELVTDMNQYFDILNRLPLHPKHKLLIITRYIYSKLRWRFSIYDLTSTWVSQNIDTIVLE